MLLVVLGLEVLFYSLYMRFSKNEGNIFLYSIVFTIATLGIYVLYDYRVLSYLLFFVIGLIGIRLIVGVKVLNYDVLVLIASCFLKLILELPLTPLFYLITKSIFIATLIVSIIKILFLIIFRKGLKKLYDKFLIKWNNNDFYIRYITSILIMLFIIATCILMVVKLI